MRKYSYSCNVKNYITRGREILFKEENDRLVVKMSWECEKKEFVGKIYEENKKTYIEGEFHLKKLYYYIIIFIWIFILSTIVILLSWGVFDIEIIGICVFAGAFYTLLNTHYRDRKYENKISDFLRKSLEFS